MPFSREMKIKKWNIEGVTLILLEKLKKSLNFSGSTRFLILSTDRQLVSII